MGCTQSRTLRAGPRAVVSSKDLPTAKKSKDLDLSEKRFTKEISTETTVKMIGEVEEEECKLEDHLFEMEQVVQVEQIFAEVNTERRRLSIMRSNHQDPRKGMRQRPMSMSISAPPPGMTTPLPDHGQDIGNGAFGENGESTSLGLRYSCLTRPGNDPAKRQKENQDTYCVHDGLDRDDECFVVCVFDGHGPNGTLASNYVRDRLIRIWKEMGLGRKSCQDEDEIRRILHNGCVEVNHKLATSHVDVYISGSTGILGIMKGRSLYVANVGDSRAVLGRVGDGGQLQAVDLSIDQKPELPNELARIQRNGGRVFEWGVPRVWQKDVDMPGLAMARSFGDLAAEAVGVFAEPEITKVDLSSNDKFLIFATDGVWEFLSSAEVVRIIAKHMANKPPAVAARDASLEVIKASVARWNALEDVVDDSTCVIVALDSQ